MSAADGPLAVAAVAALPAPVTAAYATPMTRSPDARTAYPAARCRRRRRGFFPLNFLPRFRSGDIGVGGSSADQVDGGEQADPDDIDEMPVVGDDDGADLLLLGEGLGGVRASQQEQEGDQATGHVQAVEPGGDVEHRPVPAG